MIISRLTDGLGNQLFQYAAARRLAHRHRTSLKLDLQWFSTQSKRAYELDAFQITASQATLGDIARVHLPEAIYRWLPSRLGRSGARIPSAVLRRMGVKSKWHERTLSYDPNRELPPLILGRVVSERHLHFDAEVLSAPDNVALCGYFQSEKYFAEIADIIRDEFRFRAPLVGKNREAAAAIRGCEAVSLHVRRGDKVVHANANSTSLSFCRSAMRWFQERCRSPRFFVFSDDMPWARENLTGLADIVFVDHNDGSQASEDLRLMSMCQHNIITHSSFSWWGAWLNANPDKIVVSPHPRYWMNIENMIDRDFVPEEWVVLDESTVPWREAQTVAGVGE